MFDYKSPIDILRTDIEVQMEGEIMKAVQKIAPYVDKGELLKLLKNDRESYENGYDDGYDDGFNANKWIPCSERLPEIDGNVLLTIAIDGKTVIELGSHLGDLEWCIYDEYYNYTDTK